MNEAKFRESIAWRKAMELTKAVYDATAEFPKAEMFGLTNQLRRAAVSIASNLAEGQGRLTVREFLHFLGVARGSVLEVETQLEIASMIGMGDPGALQRAQQLGQETRRIINAAISTTRANL
jgi:four helix bundle protein